MLTRIRAA